MKVETQITLEDHSLNETDKMTMEESTFSDVPFASDARYGSTVEFEEEFQSCILFEDFNWDMSLDNVTSSLEDSLEMSDFTLNLAKICL
mmetsp:Transcript_29113/g.28149  ORF Transcript_29113/g.28149 Transcript_29113/m.28149 type:complete len:89 (+) Transcript_29113:489-755(+)